MIIIQNQYYQKLEPNGGHCNLILLYKKNLKIRRMPIVKMEKPPLKTHTIKVQPNLSDNNQKPSKQERQQESNKNQVRPKITRSTKNVQEFLQSDHVVGRGSINHKLFYLYFSNGQTVFDAKWIQAYDLGRKAKTYLTIYTLFEGRIISNNKSIPPKNKAFVDVEYIEKYLERNRKLLKNFVKSNKTKAQELQSKFIYDFQVLKFRLNGFQQIQRTPSRNKKSTAKNCIKIEEEQRQQLELNPVTLPPKSITSQIKVKNTSNQNKKEQVIVCNTSSGSSNSFESLGTKSISFNTSRKGDFSKEEVTDVKYTGKIKEKSGNYENLYRFSLLYHPDIYSTMKIIKEDDFLRDAFIKFAQLLYEQFKKQ